MRDKRSSTHRILVLAFLLAGSALGLLIVTGARLPMATTVEVDTQAAIAPVDVVPEPPPSLRDCRAPYAWRIDMPLEDAVTEIRRAAERSVLQPIAGYADTTFLSPDSRGVRVPRDAEESGGYAERFSWHQDATGPVISARERVYAYPSSCNRTP